MKHSRFLLTFVVGLSLLLGLVAVAGGVGRSAHAATTLFVTDCSGETGTGRIGTVIGSASAGDTITFSCSGTIPITSTLIISTNHLTLDGSGQSVTLDGGNSVQVLSVNGGVTFTLNALTVAHGSAFKGGGLANSGTVTITNSTFANNSASSGGGGGLLNDGTLTISNSTFANNSTESSGGGLLNGGTLTISNSTFANNSASIGGGGGLLNDGMLTISNSTFANNSATHLGGGGLFNLVTLTIGGSIVANNTGGDCFQTGTLTDQGYNLESGTDCGFTGTGDLQNTDPKLASALASNGGPTQTIALLSGSPAIDIIPAASCPATDQRGVSRPDNGETTCDMGAYEFTDPVDKDLGLSGLPTTITVNATSPSGAVVTYTEPTATDESGDTPGPSVNCSPVSGSTFAIGTTTVTCTASDSDDTNSPVSGSFQVVVNGAATQTSALIATINGFHLPGNVSKSFTSQLQTVLADLSAGNTAQACSDLTGFINHVKAQSGKQLTVGQANQLIAAATQIRAVLGC